MLDRCSIGVDRRVENVSSICVMTCQLEDYARKVLGVNKMNDLCVRMYACVRAYMINVMVMGFR